jgi:hypothetical protein
MYSGRVYVLDYHELKNILLKEIPNVPYVGNLGYQKTIAIVKK